ncbi:toll-like receptor Toll6-like 3 [Homarus americanus]|uniref:Toll-like receptor Toll6-like 3 n=1 Tax=Homarus americanus TaxID=6706 RepID=A0A8J5JYH3_HOMAM|nr:toll-like receptor Toll6-like 3 [Homarus americanus]
MSRSVTWTLLVVIGLFYVVTAEEETKFKCPTSAKYFFPCFCTRGGENGIFLRCENTNLASVAVGLANVRLPIEELHLYKCNFKKLYGDVFRSLLLHKVVLEDTPVSEVNGDVFEPVADILTGLHFIRAPLQDLPEAALRPLKNLKVLEINGANLTRGLPKMKKIDLSYNKLTNIPNGVFKNKRNVRALDLSYNKFSKLDSKYFQDLNQMTWCNMSHNQIKDFGRNTFARNSVLGWLSISHNLIKRVEAHTFRSLRFLRRLYLSDNLIDTVGRSAFNGASRIGTIDLSRNKLNSVDTKVFEDLQHCEIIDLAENQITTIKKNAFVDLHLVSINISHNQITTFEDESFVNTNNITVLDLSYNNISLMQEDAFSGLSSYMTELKLEYNNISDLSHITLKFSGIKILNVSYNRIEIIPRRTFPELYALHTIDASHNQITTIDRSVFSGLYSIRRMNLSHNKLKILKGSIFGSLPTLLRVDMSYNEITMISRGMFASLVSLRELWLNNNAINSIFLIPQALNYLHFQHNNISSIRAGHTWPLMNALLYLDLDHNNLGDSMGGGTFQNLNSLRTLSLNNNSITEPPWQAFSEMHTLQYLNLDYNKITNLTRGAFGRLPVVFRLNLAYNGMTNISKQSFEGLLQLLSLNLSHNALHHIPNEAFRGCVSMQSIDLSHNFLKKIDNNTNGLMDDLLSVRHINVSHNLFGTVSKKMFPYHKWIPYNVQTVDMSYNNMPVLHKNLLIGLQKVKHINVSHNFLNEIRPNVIGNLTKLEVLDLSSNDLEALGNSVFGRGRSLREVHLQNNSLISVPAHILMSNENLTYLDLSDNNLHHYYEEFVPRVTNGTTVRYTNNPILCDCSMRRIRSWLDTWLRSEPWRDIVCHSPLHLVGRPLSAIFEEELRCNDERRGQDLYQVNPDVRFRFFGENPDELHKLDVLWYVTTREDVGGFKVMVFNITSGEEVTQHPFSYTLRRGFFPDVPRGKYRVCVSAVDSTNQTRALQPSQCHRFNVNHTSTLTPKPILVLLFTSLIVLLGFR